MIFPESFGHYKVERIISTNGKSTVLGAICTDDNKLYACKMIVRSGLRNEDMILLEHEIRIHQFLNHPNILKMKEVLYLDDFIIIVTEYCSKGDLLENIRLGRVAGNRLIHDFIYQILDAVNYLHHKGYVHMDIKPDNIFIDDNYQIKLGDFGCCVEADRFSPERIVGTLIYMAPELLRQGLVLSPHNEDQNPIIIPQMCDIWSLGVVFYAMVTKNIPWATTDEKKLVEEIINGDVLYYYDTNSISTNGLSPFPLKIMELIRNCLQKDPRRRTSCEELMKMSIFSFEKRREIVKCDTMKRRMRHKSLCMDLRCSKQYLSQSLSKNLIFPVASPFYRQKIKTAGNYTPEKKVSSLYGSFKMSDH